LTAIVRRGPSSTLHPAAVVGHLLALQAGQEVLEADSVEGEVLQLQDALLRRQLLDADEVDGRVVAAIDPGAGERERRPEAGAHAKHAVVPLHHALDIGCVDVDVIELLDLHGLHDASSGWGMARR